MGRAECFLRFNTFSMHDHIGLNQWLELLRVYSGAMTFIKLVEGFIDIITMHFIYFPKMCGSKKELFLIKFTYFACLAFRPYDNGKVITFKIFILLS